MSELRRNRSSVTIRYAVDDHRKSDRGSRHLYLESVDLGDGETVGGLFAWMHENDERERLRRVLTFDLFDVADDFLHYRSDNPDSVNLYQGSMVTGPKWWIPRPPLSQILDDWEEFLRTEEPVEKTYSWAEATLTPELMATLDFSSDTAAAVEVDFWVDERSGRPVAATDSLDSQGKDRLQAFLNWPQFSHTQVAALLTERETLSVYSNTCVFRCSPTRARIWRRDDSEDDDFLALSRGQFESLIDEWIAFTDDLIPFRKTYPVDPR